MSHNYPFLLYKLPVKSILAGIFLFSQRHQLPPYFIYGFKNQGSAGFADFLLAADDQQKSATLRLRFSFFMPSTNHRLCCCSLACCFWASSRRFWKFDFFCGFFLLASMVALTLSSSIILRKTNIWMKVMMLTSM